VLSVLADKDIRAIAEELLPYATMVVLTTTGHTRSASLEHLATAIWPYVQGRIQLCPDPPTAMETALAAAAPHDLVCATGSMAVVAAAREYLAAYLGQRHQNQTAP
jgi:folylpolyglutamate synthase/dihydropteroate synthase